MAELTTSNQSNEIVALLKALGDKGIQIGDVMKALKVAKDSGVIKGAKRGKTPENDPLRVSIRDAILGLSVNGGTLMSKVAGATTDSTSFMVTLDDNWKINFVKNVAKPKKDKKEKEKVEKGPEQLAEPTVV